MLITGSIQRQKGQYFALQALEKLKNYPGGVCLHIAGNFVDIGERDRILDFVRRASLEEKVV